MCNIQQAHSTAQQVQFRRCDTFCRLSDIMEEINEELETLKYNSEDMYRIEQP